MTEIILIGAVGRRGQLGLNGGLPWGDDFLEDRLRFRDVTTNHIVIFGYKTWRSLEHLDGTFGRVFLSDWTELSVPDVIKKIGRNTIFIAGGAKTYKRWIPYVTRFDITVLPFDGPADVWMPPLFVLDPAPSDRKAWLQAEIATLNRMIAQRKDRDPIGFHQYTAKREELQAELFALTGDEDGHR